MGAPDRMRNCDGSPREPRDVEREVLQLSGAQATRIVDQPDAVIAEHSHAWPILSLFVAGGYRKISDEGVADIASPAAVLHSAGAPHASRAGCFGAEQIDIEFDPCWLGMDLSEVRPVQSWVGGAAGAAARKLASQWTSGRCDERTLASQTLAFLQSCLKRSDPIHPAWLPEVVDLLSREHPPSTQEIANRLDLHPGWLAQAYRGAVGEGICETVRRHRVERAAILLREQEASHAQVAIEAGFCDQSHMIRCFKAVLGRTPLRDPSETIS